MDIAALSVVANQGEVQQQVGISVLKMAMGVAAEQSNSMVAMANELSSVTELSVRPYLGSNIDILA